MAADAADSPSIDSKSQFSEIPEYYNVVYSPNFQMNPGMENIITFNYLSGLATDKIIGNKWFSEKRFTGKIGGIVCRFAKNIFVDTPIDYYSVVVSHEFFGHGARYRELNIENINYGFDAPPPYGDGGGHATAHIEGLISGDELMTILIGGIETQEIINKKLRMRWMANKKIRYHESSLYNWSFRIMFDYIMATKNDLGENKDGKDTSEYLILLNEKAGINDLSNPEMDVDYLKSRLWIDFVNPFSWYSLYCMYKTYLWDGNSATKVPMMHFGNIGYLPALRMGLTPFGPEYHLENYFRLNTSAVLFDLHIGDNTFYNSWGGLDFSVQNIFNRRRLAIDFDLSIWKQPGIDLLMNKTDEVGKGGGGAISFTGHYDFLVSKNPVSAVIQLGYKTAGYSEGLDLDASPILMFGLGYKN